MVDTVVSTLITTQVLLASGDTVSVTPLGWVNFDIGSQGAIHATGDNIAATVDGVLTNLAVSGFGIRLDGDDNSLTIGATAIIRST